VTSSSRRARNRFAGPIAAVNDVRSVCAHEPDARLRSDLRATPGDSSRAALRLGPPSMTPDDAARSVLTSLRGRRAKPDERAPRASHSRLERDLFLSAPELATGSAFGLEGEAARYAGALASTSPPFGCHEARQAPLAHRPRAALVGSARNAPERRRGGARAAPPSLSLSLSPIGRAHDADVRARRSLLSASLWTTTPRRAHDRAKETVKASSRERHRPDDATARLRLVDRMRCSARASSLDARTASGPRGSGAEAERAVRVS